MIDNSTTLFMHSLKKYHGADTIKPTKKAASKKQIAGQRTANRLHG